MEVKIINDSKQSLLEYSTNASADLGLRAHLDSAITPKPLERALISTGLFIELPVGCEAQIRPRSGLAYKQGITVLNTLRTIDADYSGEIKVILVNLSNNEFIVEDGERIAQIVVTTHKRVEWKQVKELLETDRGAGGFGNTGVK